MLTSGMNYNNLLATMLAATDGDVARFMSFDRPRDDRRRSEASVTMTNEECSKSIVAAC